MMNRRVTRTTRRHEYSDSEIADMMFRFDFFAEVRGEDNRIAHEALIEAIDEPIAAFRAEGALWHLFVAMEDAANVAAAKSLTDPWAVEDWSAAVSVLASLNHTDLPDARQRFDAAAREFQTRRDGYAIEYTR